MYDYQKTNRYIAQVADGLEELTCEEFVRLGAAQCSPGFRYLNFAANHATLYRLVYRSRLATRILAPLTRFHCPTEKILYERGRDIHWADFLHADQTFAIFANVSKSAIGHSQYAALKLKDAIADWFRDQGGKRPDVEPRTPDIWIHLHIHENAATISMDCSGGSMHRRGYRVQSVEAPMQETVAAAIIAMSGWSGDTPLLDPLCGSGTLLCEAYMAATDIPAGFLRKNFGFTHLPDYQENLWDEECDLPLSLDCEINLRGGDIALSAVEATRANLARLPGGDELIVGRKDFFERTAISGTAIICNPPYGIRLGQTEDMNAWFKRFGDHLKRACTGSTAYVYFGDRSFLKAIGLRPEWKKPLKNGGLDGRLAKFNLY